MAVDNTDLSRLVSTLSMAVYDAPKETRKVVSKGAVNVKSGWRKSWSGHPHIALLPPAIGYDVSQTLLAVAAEIGPEASTPQAPIAHLIEFGSPKSAPLPGGLAALAAEEPRFVSELEKLAVGLLER